MERLNHTFTPHSDYKNELIEAEHVNELQRAISDSQRVLNSHVKDVFISNLFFQFKNQDRFNAVQLFEYGNKLQCDATRSTNLAWDEQCQGVKINHVGKPCHFITKVLSSHLEDATLSQMAIMSDMDETHGALNWFILVGEGEEEHPIEPTFSSSSLPLLPHELEMTQYRIKIVFEPSEDGNSPILHNFACLYEDQKLANQLITTI